MEAAGWRTTTPVDITAVSAALCLLFADLIAVTTVTALTQWPSTKG